MVKTEAFIRERTTIMSMFARTPRKHRNPKTAHIAAYWNDGRGDDGMSVAFDSEKFSMLAILFIICMIFWTLCRKHVSIIHRHTFSWDMETGSNQTSVPIWALYLFFIFGHLHEDWITDQSLITIHSGLGPALVKRGFCYTVAGSYRVQNIQIISHVNRKIRRSKL